MYTNNVMDKPFPVNLYEAITGTDTMPVDGTGTLYYLLELVAPKNKQLLMQRFKEGFSYRKIGVLNGVSGSRIEAVVSDTIEGLKAQKTLLIDGVANSLAKASMICKSEVREKLDAECREKYTKEGYQMGYADGLMKREKTFYSYGKSDEVTIDDMDLSHRSYNALQGNGIYTVSDIINVGNGLMQVRNLGKKSLEEIIMKLYEMGVDVKKYFMRVILTYEFNFFAEE